MAKKLELLEQAKKLKLDVTSKNTIAEIEAAIASAKPKEDAPVVDSESEEKEGAAKAGKRSTKSLKEAEEKAEKEERKAKGDTTPKESKDTRPPKGPKPVTRPKIERRGKNYRKLSEAIEKDKVYSLTEALELATKTSPAKFDASVELHVRLGVDPRLADQNVRATVSLPHGTGKTVRVAVFAPADQIDDAKKAGADLIGEEAVIALLDKERLDFDILIATPQLMPKLGKYARLLGPRGLMPNPKSGTVATNVSKAVKEAKAGKVEYRVDKQAIVHLAVGKVSFGGDKLSKNAQAFFESLQNVKPSSLKGSYIKSVSISTTMGPGIKVDSAAL
jgi:ribosomal protein L1